MPQKGQKSDVVTVLVRLEFGEHIIGESGKLECSVDQETVVDYSTSLPVSSEDALLVDELASKPLLCKLPTLQLWLFWTLLIVEQSSLDG